MSTHGRMPTNEKVFARCCKNFVLSFTSQGINCFNSRDHTRTIAKGRIRCLCDWETASRKHENEMKTNDVCWENLQSSHAIGSFQAAISVDAARLCKTRKAPYLEQLAQSPRRVIHSFSTVSVESGKGAHSLRLVRYDFINAKVLRGRDPLSEKQT